jgi:hypothetical protein
MKRQDEIWLQGILDDVDKFMQATDAPREIKSKWRAIYNTTMMLQQSSNMMHSELEHEEDKFYDLSRAHDVANSRLDAIEAILYQNKHVWADESE